MTIFEVRALLAPAYFFHFHSVVAAVMEYAPRGTLFQIMCEDQYIDGFDKPVVQRIAVQVYSYAIPCLP